MYQRFHTEAQRHRGREEIKKTSHRGAEAQGKIHHGVPRSEDTEGHGGNIKDDTSFVREGLCVSKIRCSWLKKLSIFAAALALAACTSREALEDPPIITSATHQHALYNGRGQPIEAIASREGAPPPVITYFRSEEDLHADRDGSPEAPAEVGDYYVRIRRPAGNGFRAGNDITVEYHIQKALVTIRAEARQEFAYDGNPRAVVFSVDQNVDAGVAYYHAASAMPGFSLGEPPIERGVYLAVISWGGDAHYMGASKEVELVIR